MEVKTNVVSLLRKALENGLSVFQEEQKLKIKVAQGIVPDPEIIGLLKANKEEIIAFLKDGMGGAEDMKTFGEPILPIDRSNPDQRIPLSFSQEQLWFIDQLGGSMQYHQPLALRIKNRLDKQILEESLLALVDRHETLRTVVKSEDGRPYQEIMPSEGWTMAYSEGDAFRDEQYLVEFIESVFNQPFDLGRDYMFRAHLIRCGEDDNVLALVMHHIASDGWSKSILVNDLIEIYAARQEGRRPALPPLKINYADFAFWQRNRLSGDVLESKLGWWESQLKGVETIRLPYDFQRPATHSARGAVTQLRIEKDLADDLKALSIERETTLFMTLLTAFNTLLHRLTGQEDICVGTPLANRNQEELEPIVGFFVNSLALRNNLGGDPRFSELLQKVKSAALSAFANQEVPLEQIVRKIEPERSLNRNPVFQVMFVIQNIPEIPDLELGDLSLSPVRTGHEYSKFDLVFSANDSPMGLFFDIVYCRDLFLEETVKRMAGNFRQLLRSVVSDPDQRISNLSIISDEEKVATFRKSIGTETSYPADKTLIDLFYHQVDENPDEIALVFDGKVLTYSDLDQQSNRLANCLLTKGVKPQDRVGLLSTRGIEMITGILAILKCRGVYVPLNLEYPASRLAFMLQDAAADLVVASDTALVEKFDLPQVEIIDTRAAASCSPDRRACQSASGDGVYIMYTSGTTGTPKGTLVSQQNVLKLVHEPGPIAVKPGDRVLQWSNFAFDGSVYDIFCSLLNGASLHLVSEDAVSDPGKLTAVLQEQKITVWFVTTALFNAMVDFDPAGLKGLRKLLFGGELVSIPHARKAFNVLGPGKLVHVYGPTETTVYCTYYPIDSMASGKVPIGKPLSNSSVYILDKAGNLAGTGVAGEILIGGHGVSEGYINRPELTAQKYISAPFRSPFGQRLYKSGDIGVLMNDGNIDFIGRRDAQLKIRGYRIELGEIESVLQDCPQVARCTVIAGEDGSGAKKLVGYYVPHLEIDAEPAGANEAIRAYLKNRLPDYMIPAFLIPLDHLPLNPNGKVDRNALPGWEDLSVAGDIRIMPRTATEIKVAEIWETLLHLKNISANDNFFEIGGHSLLAMRVIAAVRKNLGRELKVKDVFTHTTVAGLASRLDSLAGTISRPPIVPGDRPEQIPLSFSQERLWLVDQLEGSVHYHIPQLFSIGGKLNEDALECAFADLVDRHEILRTVYSLEKGRPVQKILDAGKWRMTVLDRQSPDAGPAGEDWIAASVKKPFDLAADHMLRVWLMKKAPDQYDLLIVLHHIAADGWSIPILMRELTACYRARIQGQTPNLAPLQVQYADYAVWQRKHLTPPQLEEQLTYWVNQLAGAPPLQLPLDFPRPAVRSARGAVTSLLIPDTHFQELAAICRNEEVTLFMLLTAALKVLLYRYTGQTDICIGTSVGNRGSQEAEPLIGFFINTLALRSRFGDKPTFREFLNRTKSNCLDAFARQEAPFEQVLERVAPERVPGRNPLFDVMFILQNASGPGNSADLNEGGLGELTMTAEDRGIANSKFDLAITATETPDGLSLKAIYNPDLFQEESMTGMMDHFGNLLGRLKDHLDQPVSAIDICSAGEKAALLQRSKPAPVSFHGPQTLLDQFEAQAAKTPDNPAAVFEGAALSYKELDEKANRWAHFLSARGVGKGDIVGISLQRSLDMITAVLAVFKTGAAYLPIDPDFPETRIAFMLKDAGVKYVLTHHLHRDRFTGSPLAGLFAMDRDLAAGQPSDKPGPGPNPDDAAYVIYTSGSTGRPKGVIMDHAGVVNQGYWAIDFLELKSSDVVIQKTSFCFDPSVWEFFWPLSAGGQICFAGPGLEGDSRHLVATIEKHKVTIICLVPSMLSAFLEDLAPGECSSLRIIICGGEVLHKSQLILCRQKLPRVKVRNMYGPTEAAIHVTCWPVPENLDRTDVIPIGKPLPNVRIYILNDDLQLNPEGIAGELCIGGIQLARGYLNRPELTREKFVRLSIEDGGESVIYRTGDLARWLPDGDIEYLGRKDNQLKINGFRVELEEVEYLLGKTPGIRSAVVVARKDPFGHNRLIAYVIPDNKFDKAAAETHLRDMAPAYMTPSIWVQLEAFPLGTTGKVDRHALPEPDLRQLVENNYVPPGSDSEIILVGIFSELLHLEKVGIKDNFFEIGGHSLLAVRVISAIREKMNREIKVRDLFTWPTAESLALHLQSTGPETGLPPLKKAEPRPERIPLSYSQERLWFVDQLRGSVQFHQATVLQLNNELDRNVLEQALKALVSRHESLRSVIRSEDGQPYQAVLGPQSWRMEYSDFSGSADRADIQGLIDEVVNRPFELDADYMLRAHLVRQAPGEHLLILVIHHIASDGWSDAVLVEDLTELYRAYLGSGLPDLPELPVQYPDYAIWQREHIAGKYLEDQLAWWKEQLAGLEPLEIPIDFPRPARQSNRGDTYGFSVENQLLRELKALSLQSEATLFMTLLSALKILLARYAGKEDICVGTSLANRNHKSLERLAGFFVNNLVLRTQIEPGSTFRGVLEQVRSTVLSAFAHQDVPFEKIVDLVETGRNLNRTPVFQVLFTLHNTPEVPVLEFDNLHLSPVSSGQKRTLYDLSFYLRETPAGLQVSIVYCTDLFSRGTIESIANHFHNLLRSAASMPDHQIEELSMISEQEAVNLMQGSASAEKSPYDNTFVNLFEEQAARTPESPAVVFEAATWTYSELNERANRIAWYLKDEFNIRPNDLVGMAMDGSHWAVAAIIGILKTGAAYVPVNIEFPAERIRYMIEDTRMKALALHKDRSVDLAGFESLFFNVQDAASGDTDTTRTANPEDVTYPDHRIYVIYTSGSTGASKGVEITHRNLSNYLSGLLDKVDIQSCRSFGLMSTLSADLGNTVLYGALGTGGALHVFSRKTLTDASAIQAYFKENPIDCIKIVPSHWRALETDSGLLLPARTIIFGGESLTVDILEKIRRSNPALEVINHYGPTEATIGKVLHRVNLAANYNTVPIGRPFSQARAYVVDQHLKLCPPGVPGELLLGGEGVAKGYFNRPELTRAKFIKDPFSPNEQDKVYLTGDVVRQLPDGNLEFIGRKDDQLKIRGYRVELGEIEHALNASPMVNGCVVLGKTDTSGNINLVAYIVPENGFERAELQAYLGTILPDYMIPSIWMELAQLPLTENGKINRKALPEPVFTTSSDAEFVAPRTETEKILAEIWCKLLKLDNVGIHDHFFEIGGHSLLAIRVISAIRKAFSQKPDLEDIFSYPTIAELAEFLQNKQNPDTLPAVTAGPRPEKIPLSFAQERLWFTDQLGGSVQYHMPSVLRLRNKLDITVLEEALGDLVRRHEVLRTVFKSENGEPFQVVLPADNWKMTFSEPESAGDEGQLRQLILEQVNTPFDLATDFMLRAHLFKCGEEEHRLVLVLHHIAADGWSISLLVSDLMELYSARLERRPSRLPDLPIQYADYAVWQRSHLSGEVLASQLDWWVAGLKGLEPLSLPTDFPRPAIQSTRGDSMGFRIEKDLTDQLKAAALEADVTLFMLLLSAYKVMLSQYSGQTDFCIGAPLANRDQKEVENLVGCFLNALVLRTDLSGNPRFSDLLQTVKSNTLAAFNHQQVPFEQIVDRVESDRSLSRSPVFQVLFSMRNTPEVPDLQLGELQLKAEPSGQQISQLDLAFYVRESPGGLDISILFCTDLFLPETIERMARHFTRLLESIVSNPDHPIDELELLTAREADLLLNEFNNTAAPYPDNRSIVSLFEEKAALYPEKTAVTFQNRALTYSQLDDQAAKLAAYLKATYQLGPDDLVGVMTPRSEWAIIACLGILKAGAAFVPIDINLPKDRKSFLMEDTGIKALIAHSDNLYDLITGGFNIPVFAIDMQLGTLTDRLPEEASKEILLDQLAYVIYTSGSTGNPKGVLIEHQSIKNTILSQIKDFGITEGDRCLQFYALSFDASILEIFTALLAGARLCIIGQDDRTNPSRLYAFLREQGITIGSIPPAYLNELNMNELESMRTLFTGGESAAPDRIRKFLEWGNYINSYGPTEAGICATVFRIDRGGELPYANIPIGRPIDNAQVYTLNAAGKQTPIGVPGELYIGGAGLARGYLNNEELTRISFAYADPAGKGPMRLYKTGDLARFLPDGNLEFLGRRDNQVKIRGHRIELGEIEAALNAHPAVRSCAVITAAGPSGNLQLAAYIVPAGEYNKPALQAHLISRLPDYMVPSYWTKMDQLPLTETGKVNKSALPTPDASGQIDQEYTAPRNRTEEILAGIWADLLKVEKVGIHDNFFALGGHSLLAVRLLSLVRDNFSLDIPLKVVFEFPTIGEFQKYIALQQNDTDGGQQEDSEVFEL